MAKNNKTLLEEGTVRRFMKLAEIGTLAGSFLEGYDTMQDDDELALDEPALDEPALDEPALGGEEELELDLDAEEPAEEAEEGEITLTDEEVDSLVAAFDAAEGVVEKLRGAGEEPEEVEAIDMGAEMEVEPVEGEELGGEELGGEELGGEEDELAEISVVDDDALVNEVAARVAKRLLTRKNK